MTAPHGGVHGHGDAAGRGDAVELTPVQRPVDAVVRPPGSKSITNRALVCAALAEGTTELAGVLAADDTEAMVDCLRALGVRVAWSAADALAEVVGCDGRPPAAGAVLDARLSGTTSRFVAPVAALGRGTVVLDGAEPLRRRPMADLLDALGELGAGIESLGAPGHLPVRLEADGLRGGRIEVAGDTSSQFLSGLLLAAPCTARGLELSVATALVSLPYVALTAQVMAAFGAPVDLSGLGADGGTVAVAPGGYTSPGRFDVEPDASAASYFLAAAAVTGGRVRIDGLGRRSGQGDVAFAEVLGRMGAAVTVAGDHVEVVGTGELHGVEADLTDCSDTAQTLAAVAALADSPTTVTGIGFIRGKETDRIAAVVSELRRLGVEAREDADGFTVVPGPTRPATVATYDDHRMAMSFAVVGVARPGVRIAEAACVDKTYPRFWEDLAAVVEPAGGGVRWVPTR